MNTSNFPQFYSSRKKEINLTLRRVLPDSSSSKLAEAMRYSTLNGGKRLRGIFLLEGADTRTHKNPLLSKKLAAGVELVHAYSLIHDDLPSMDDDSFRRGRESCHVKYDNHTAILAGNSLLSRAFEIYTQLDFPTLIDNVSSPVNELAKITGYQGVPIGQQKDMDYEEEDPSLKEIIEMYKHKTGLLFGFSLKIGALAGGVAPDKASEMKQAGIQFGIAYQIRNDLIDCSPENGKSSVNSDARNDKRTLLKVLGERKAKDLAQEKVEESVQGLDSLNIETRRMQKLFRSIMNPAPAQSVNV